MDGHSVQCPAFVGTSHFLPHGCEEAWRRTRKDLLPCLQSVPLEPRRKQCKVLFANQSPSLMPIPRGLRPNPRGLFLPVFCFYGDCDEVDLSWQWTAQHNSALFRLTLGPWFESLLGSQLLKSSEGHNPLPAHSLYWKGQYGTCDRNGEVF